MVREGGGGENYWLTDHWDDGSIEEGEDTGAAAAEAETEVGSRNRSNMEFQRSQTISARIK